MENTAEQQAEPIPDDFYLAHKQSPLKISP
jgi:hypothetical protein